MKYKIVQADVNTVSPDDLDGLFHALLSDPPYHLESIVKRFGKQDSAPAQYGKDGAFGRVGKGFMGKAWDGGDVAFRAGTWHNLLAKLYPGGFGMAFSSAKLFHRMMVAIEDGGAVMHPMIGWTYSSGFPKATRIDTQADKLEGKLDQRGVISTSRQLIKDSLREMEGRKDRLAPTFDYTSAASELGKVWQGHRYGQQALAPALEPLAVFQRPYDGKPFLNIIETGAGALWIDGARIGTGETLVRQTGESDRIYKTGFDNKSGFIDNSSGMGRWPKNLLLQHDPLCECLGETEEEYTINAFDDDMHPFGDAEGEAYSSSVQKTKALVWQCVDTCAVKHFASQHGKTTSGLMTPAHNVSSEWGYHDGTRVKPTLQPTYGDSGEISRFFYQIHWSYEIFEQLQNSDAALYFAKASKTEKNTGLDHFSSQKVNDGRAKDIDNAFQRGTTLRKNTHPSVKPLDLTRYLATLLLPPAHYAPRRLLVPFSGSGSEMIGGLLAGFEEVVGVELDLDNEYIHIANARLDFWQWAINKYGSLPPKEIIRLTQKASSKKIKEVVEAQLKQQELF